MERCKSAQILATFKFLFNPARLHNDVRALPYFQTKRPGSGVGATSLPSLGGGKVAQYVLKIVANPPPRPASECLRKLADAGQRVPLPLHTAPRPSPSLDLWSSPALLKVLHPVLISYGAYLDYKYLATSRRLLDLDTSFGRSLTFTQFDTVGTLLSVLEIR